MLSRKISSTLRIVALVAMLCMTTAQSHHIYGQTNNTAKEYTPTVNHGRILARDIEPTEGYDKIALLVCVSDFEDSDISRLPGALNDCHQLQAALRDSGLPEKQIIMLYSGAAREDLRPTAGNIMATIRRINRESTTGLLIAHFVSHGVVINGHAYLLAEDSHFDSANPNLLAATAVSLDSVEALLQLSGSVRNVFVSLDICRNVLEASRSVLGSVVSGDNVMKEEFESFLMRKVTARGVARKVLGVMLGTSANMRAYEVYDGQQHYGIYSRAVTRGLLGGAADRHGRITLGGLARFVREAVIAEVTERLGAPPKQVPQLRVSDAAATDILLVEGLDHVELPPDLPPSQAIPNDHLGVALLQTGPPPEPVRVRGSMALRYGRAKTIEITIFESGIEYCDLANDTCTFIARRELRPIFQLEIAGRRLTLKPSEDVMRRLAQ